ncbi:MAG: plastocyanin/azurin family copper-binding protein [Candidatus Thermoplasmatota archaeon]
MHKAWGHWLAIVIAVVPLAGCASPGPEALNEGTVDMKDIKFIPDTMTVVVGGTVTWINSEDLNHTVTPNDKALWGTDGSGDAEAQWLPIGASWSWTFTQAGTYKYYCLPHAMKGDDGEYTGMIGTITVK